MTQTLIKDVSDTAFWIAHLRAIETERADALFRDPFAGRLAGERGRNIAAKIAISRMVGWFVAMRTCIIDRYIESAIGEGLDTVLNLGAGLDTRPYRMALPASLQWIEADYPHMIQYKEEQLAHEKPRCQLERIKVDLADAPQRQALLTRVNARAKRIFVLTEGVVPYLSVAEAGALADDLRALDHAAYWVVEYLSAEAMKRQRKGLARALQNSPFRFEPPDVLAFFREHGWRPKEIRYLGDETQRHGRAVPLPWLTKVLLRIWSPFIPETRREAFRRFAGYLLLEPAPAA